MLLTQEYSRIAALPDSRNHLRHISLEELPYPLRKAFSLMGLDDEYREMSLNEIVSAFRKSENMLQEETGWNSDDLTRELNRLLE